MNIQEIIESNPKSNQYLIDNQFDYIDNYELALSPSNTITTNAYVKDNRVVRIEDVFITVETTSTIVDEFGNYKRHSAYINIDEVTDDNLLSTFDFIFNLILGE